MSVTTLLVEFQSADFRFLEVYQPLNYRFHIRQM